MATTGGIRRPTPVLPPTFGRPGFLGTLRAFQTDPLSFMHEVARESGDVAQVRLGPRWATYLRHPDHVEHVLVHNARGYSKRTRGYAMMRKVLGQGLVTSEGEFWRRQRRIAQPAFHRRKIAGFAEAMTRSATRMLDERWDAAAAAGEPVDVSNEMAHVTLSVVSETLLGIEPGATDGRSEVVARSVPTVLEHVVHRITHPLSPHEAVPTARRQLRDDGDAADSGDDLTALPARARQRPSGRAADRYHVASNARPEDASQARYLNSITPSSISPCRMIMMSSG